VIFVLAFILLGAGMIITQLGSFPALRGRRWTFAIALAALLIADFVTHQMAMHWHVGTRAAVFASIVVIGLAFAAIPIAILVAVSWSLSRLLPGAKPKTPDEAAASPGMTRRQIVEGAGSLAILGVTTSTFAWGTLRGRFDFRLEEVPVRIPGLPRALDGYVIAQVSDIHAGDLVGDRTLDEGLALVRRAKADLLVATGDLVDYSASFAPFVARKLADVAPRDGVTVILGNHDHYAGATAVLAALRAAGLTTLVNEGRVLRPDDGGGFALLGVEDLWARRGSRKGPDLDRALEGIPEHLPRVLLSHQPKSVDEWAGRVALQLSGHTHGGQINPGVRPADVFYPYVSGTYAVKGTTLYVNRGFGTVGPPARVGAPPEVTRFVLVAA
jgi:uncharacterized protein